MATLPKEFLPIACKMPRMNGSNHCFRSGQRPSGIITASAIVALVVSSPNTTSGQTPYQTRSGEMLLCESAAASRAQEKVRSATQGVMVNIFVKPGDVVRKGQLLGNLELDATKLQLDLAKHALESKANGQAEAWKVTREETEESVRRHKAEQSRLDWALAMEKFHRGNYGVQLDAEGTQEIQYEYWKDQYEKRFFRAPLDGTVTEVLVDVGKPVTYATHVFTVSNDSSFSLPVTVPAQVAQAAVPNQSIPIRTEDGKSVSRAVVDSVMDDPATAGHKIVKLLFKAADFPAAIRPKLKGMKFDVLLPQASRDATEQVGAFR